MNPLDIVRDIFKPLTDLIGKAIPDQDKKAAALTQLATLQIDAENRALDAAKSTVLAEETGELWIQKAWRPLVSIGIFFCIMYAGPIVSVFHFPQMNMDGVPPELWKTFQICVGGYMGARSVEKIVTAVKG